MISVSILVLLAMCVRTNSLERPINYGKDNVGAILIFKNGEEVAINCLNVTLDKMGEEIEIPMILRPKYLELVGCIPSDKSFAYSLNNLNIIVHQKLVIHSLVNHDFNRTHFKGFFIDELRITISREVEVSYLRPSYDFLKPLYTLTSLDVTYMILPPLPKKSKIEKLVLSNGLSKNAIGGCLHLQELSITQWEIIQEGWLRNCSMLKTLKLASLSIQVINRLLFGVDFLQSLTIRESKLECLGYKKSCRNIFDSLVNVKSLDLSSNGIKNLDISTFKNLKSLQDLNLSANKITEFPDIAFSLKSLHNLKILTLSHNSLEYMCSYAIIDFMSIKVERLILSETGLTDLCTRLFTGSSTVYLDMRSNRINVLKFNSLPVSRKLPLTIDLRGNRIHEIQMTKDIFLQLEKFQMTSEADLKIIMNFTNIECDCEHKWLSRALRSYTYIHVDGLKCNGNQSLETIPFSDINCDKLQCWPGCVCRKWQNGTVDANCTLTTAIPQIAHLRRLYAQGAGIQSIRSKELPSSLQYIDLSKNKLSHVDADSAAALFAGSTRKLLLSGNPFACDCNNSIFITTLQKHQDMIKDYDDIMCVGDEISIKDIKAPLLCKLEKRQALLAAALAASGTLAVIIVASTIFYQKYRREIRVLLHSLGWFPCLFPEENDEDFFYDVFISYSHTDEDIVVDTLLPKLEGKPHEYSVCVHFRDWIAGEWIPMQIARSVQLSRRTLIVVSSSFLDSMWGLLEFRTAMMSSARDGFPRVILVLMDESLNQDARLDPELRAYMSTNTYLCWGDPWFWNKLYYALPHRKRRKMFGPMSKIFTESSSDAIELCSRNTF